MKKRNETVLLLGSRGGIKMNKKHLWKFYWDCGRMGEVEGLFVATQEDIDEVIGKEIYFGEILGKHSEVYGTLDNEDLKKIELDQKSIETLISELGNTWSGYNPLSYIEEE
jgi:hypothetical protein